ncbi:Pre-rRNA-processing protein TSR2 [Clavispora lusitaniae]|uniref:Pre-rRNA-processing protein n=1 Tax=Clavispora lusitaniae (strain ATCC 42720) TaxID=306902 RepID=C4XYD8_CLAL4|nr:uncharacterized protein CLUG_00961 [Clavispora lusitaniae ATCC 42720]EEQ36838.1 hypothetical protein CLUG_00961 [Clavispora lusitaniae ATCC 42720]KAF7584835.1 Pre-rRNA-processing protein TSR2 [Clavispora lusitaniae]
MASIDPTDFVQVEDDSTSLKFEDPKQQAKFELGVCMAIYKWEELTTAVENSWGGPTSADKRDWLSGVIIDLFDEKAVDIMLIEETLLYAMVDEFDTEIDNDSALIIGDLILKLYRDCALKNYARVDELYANYQQKQASRARAQKVEISADPNNPDVSDDDDEEEEESAPQLVEEDSMDVDNGPVIDDDGFELVQRKGRRR